MEISLNGIKSEEFEKAGIKTPKYDIAQMRAETEKNPTWIHFGVGNIFRIFPARLCDIMLEKGLHKTGIIACETFDEEIVDDIMAPNDNMTVGVMLKVDGSMETSVISSIAKTLKYSQSTEEVNSIFANPSLQLVSFTITEKGYQQPRRTSDFDDMENLMSVPAILAKLLFHRFQNGAYPIAIVSMDNVAKNGTVLKGAVLNIVNSWKDNGVVSEDFVAYLSDANLVTFNHTMIDKITPRPEESVQNKLKEMGIVGMDIIRTSKNTFASGFVNAEECEYLAIEDTFPNGRPPFEEAGVIVGSRDTIDKIEKMKVGTCLNPLHTAMSLLGCMLNIETISGCIGDADINAFVYGMTSKESMPVCENPGVINAESFLSDCLTKRFPNPYLKDTPQRIACDTSQKIKVRFGESCGEYIKEGKTDLSFMKFFPFVFASYARYLLALDDNGAEMPLSPDPNMGKYVDMLADVKFGSPEITEGVKAFFGDVDLFGLDLYAHGLAEKSIEYFLQMAKPNGVRATLSALVQG